MIYWLYKGLMLRMAGAAVVSFLIVIFLAPKLIRFLVRYKVGERPEFDHADLNQLTRHKSNTPTMGGALIVVAILVAVILFADILHNMYIKMAMVALIWLGGLGAADDWLKIRYSAGTGSRDGLKTWEKLVFQVGLAMLLSIYMLRYARYIEPVRFFYLSFSIHPIALAGWAYVVITILTMVGTSNAVNLTDGMDGLAAGCFIIVTVVFLMLSWIVGVEEWSGLFHMPLVHRSEEMTILCASMLGSCLGFLWYNSHPAQVFMGDTGSLPLGGLLGYVAVVTRQEMLLLIAGGVFVMEAASVILQVGFFKLTRPPGGMQGKRLFRCAPLHHHFHLGGWAESKVVVRFWLLGIIFAALAMATLKLKIP